MADLKNLVKEVLNHITVENWANVIWHAKNRYMSDVTREIEIDKFVESLIID